MKNLPRFPTLLLFASALTAQQQQTITISKPLQPVAAPLTGELTEVEAGALVSTVIGAGHPATDRAYMIHVVKYLDSKAAVDKQKWYVYDSREIGRPIDYRAKSRYTEARIFGRPKLGLVYLHILRGISLVTAESVLRTQALARIQSVPPNTTDADLEKDIANDLTAIAGLRVADAVAAGIPAGQRSSAQTRTAWLDLEREKFVLELLKNGATSDSRFRIKSERNQTLVPLDGYLIETVYQDMASNLTYTVLIKSKQPAPIVNLQQIAGLVFGANAAPIDIPLTLAPSAFAAGDIFETSYVPSDITVTGVYSSNMKDTTIGNQTYDDEGRYWYDFSLAVPVKTYRDVNYNQSTDSITTSTVSRANVLAFFNFGMPRDTKNMNYQLIPTGLYGMPISGKPLKHHVFAASVGLNKVNFFVGVRLDEKTFVRDFSKPLSASNQYQAWRTHAVYGINFPVSTIVTALTKKK